MKIFVLKSKIHNARVTECKPEYEGSIIIDETLMKAVNIIQYEKVLVANAENGNRYETYVMKGKKDSGIISINGAGTKYSSVGDRLTIFAFAAVEENEVLKPNIIVVDAQNRIKIQK